MPIFRYEATNAKGRRRRDSIEAADMEEAVVQLAEQGLTPLAIKLLDFESTTTPMAEPPPPPPRQVGAPWGFRVLFGLPFLGVGIGAFVALLVTRDLVWIIFSVTFGGVGLVVFLLGLRGTQRWRQVVRDGQVARGIVTATGYDASMRINGRPAYRLRYSFEAAGTPRSGKLSTFSRAVEAYSDGDALWVLYDPGDPAASAPWPPLRPA